MESFRLLSAQRLYLPARLNYPRLMRSRAPARKLSTNTQLYMSAQRALMRRAFSIHEMKQHLERRAEDKDLVPPVIARLRELNYLDDAKFALDYASQHAKTRRQGRFRIMRELRQRGVPDRYIEDAVAKAFADTDESTLLRTRIERRLARLKGPLEQKKVASIYRSMMASGFSSELIRAELKRATANRPPDTPDIEFATSDPEEPDTA
jgi:regulatory protein